MSCPVSTSNVALLGKSNEFFILEVYPVVGPKAFQLLAELILAEHLIFGSGQIFPHLSGRVFNEAHEIEGTTERAMWHRATYV